VEKSPSIDQNGAALFQPVRWPVRSVLVIGGVKWALIPS
jgi:hypothetical protein